MNPSKDLPAPLADASAVEWRQHPRFPGIAFKTLLTAAHNPFANVNLVQVPPGGVIGRHYHPKEVETVYVLAGQSVLTLGEVELPFRVGQVVAIPIGLEHALHNTGGEPVELLTFFTPPIA